MKFRARYTLYECREDMTGVEQISDPITFIVEADSEDEGYEIARKKWNRAARGLGKRVYADDCYFEKIK